MRLADNEPHGRELKRPDERNLENQEEFHNAHDASLITRSHNNTKKSFSLDSFLNGNHFKSKQM
jgi:hypothetical protein